MRKIFTKQTICICLASVVLVYSCKINYPQTSMSYTLVQTPSNIENGKRLVFGSCAGCHLNHTTKKLTGNQMHDLPRILGVLYTANLTNSKMYGMTTHYTDAQLAYLIKTGINTHGHLIPYMLRPNMADADVNDIIAYLRSGDAAVAASDTSVGKSHLNFFGRMVIHTRKPMPYIPDIQRPTETIATGKYLVDIMGCFHCHSKGLSSLNDLHPEQSKNYMMGGMMFKTPAGQKIYASNLTPCATTGIGNYSPTDFRKAVKEGVTPDGRKLSPPMDKYEDLTDEQTDAIYAYLRTLPPAHHLVKGHVETKAK